MKKQILISLILLSLFAREAVAQTATKIQVLDTRNVNTGPNGYGVEVKYEFKDRGVIGAPGTGAYGGLMTIAPWIPDGTGNKHHQLFFNDGGMFYRTGQSSNTTWDNWAQILTSNNITLDGSYGAELKKDIYPFKAYWSYSDDGTGYGPAWIHTNTNGTIHPTMFLMSSGNSAHLTINDAISLGPMLVTLGSYPQITTNTWISGSQGENSYFNNGGNVGIGTISPVYKLDVCGTIRAKEVTVDLLGGCDFVFKSDYKLMNLKELESFVKTNRHLPEIASEKEMVENGVNMKELQMKLLQKMEEMTLYMIEQNKKIEALENEIKELKTK